MHFKKILFFSILFIFSLILVGYVPALAQGDAMEPEVYSEPNFNAVQMQTEVFEAKVLEVLDEVETDTTVLQKLRLEGLSGSYEGQEIIFDGTKYQLTSANRYEAGDKVMMEVSAGMDGEDFLFVTDYVRQAPIWWLFIVFALIIIIIGRWRGFRALVGLAFSFWVILQLIVPQILAGRNPLWVSIWFSLLIIIFSTYITYGLNKKSSLAIAGTFFGVVVVGILSQVFTNMTHLAGIAQEETLFLISSIPGVINLKGLLLAGIMIGALGVLDDLTVSQVSMVAELKKANPDFGMKELYKRAMQVGVDHVASMVNTLFLAYAGASLPLLLLFGIKQEPFLSMSQVINHEVIATEIVRTLVGSIGLALAVPITTWLAAMVYAKHKENKK